MKFSEEQKRFYFVILNLIQDLGAEGGIPSPGFRVKPGMTEVNFQLGNSPT